MADRSGRPAPVRRRMKTLTQAALNADKTVEQVEDVLDGLGKTMAELNSSLSQLNSTVERLEDGLDHLEGTLHSLDDLAKRLIVLVEPVEAIVDRIDYIVSLGETVMSPLSVTEHAVRGVLDRLRNRTVHERLVAHPRVVAVGETGIDMYWPGRLDGCAEPHVQREAFAWHI
ncbi:hypothetical protein, partial [Mycobacterium tuberculosis]|uniref:hypothetical protein n=1 Tax=Mycobacterium tuberculosis TaxID=1773 RepID=UPI00339D46F8